MKEKGYEEGKKRAGEQGRGIKGGDRGCPVPCIYLVRDGVHSAVPAVLNQGLGEKFSVAKACTRSAQGLGIMDIKVQIRQWSDPKGVSASGPVASIST